MRIRQIKPEFCSDPDIAALPDAAQLFYIKLWLACDDAGWFRWDVQQLGALLYPYRSAAVRSRQIRSWADSLGDKVQIFDCGCARIPTLPRHQIVSKKITPELDRHNRLCRTIQEQSGELCRVGNGRVGNGSRAPAREGFPEDVKEAVEAIGLPQRSTP